MRFFCRRLVGKRCGRLIGSNQGGWHTNHKQKLGLLSWPPFSFMYSPFTTFPSPSNCSIILSWSSQSFRTFNRPHYTENYTPLKGCSQIHVQAHHLQKKVKQYLHSNARVICPPPMMPLIEYVVAKHCPQIIELYFHEEEENTTVLT